MYLQRGNINHECFSVSIGKLCNVFILLLQHSKVFQRKDNWLRKQVCVCVSLYVFVCVYNMLELIPKSYICKSCALPLCYLSSPTSCKYFGKKEKGRTKRHFPPLLLCWSAWQSTFLPEFNALLYALSVRQKREEQFFCFCFYLSWHK